ncbi:MAG: hypothetical protein ACLQVI_12480 [Polyangiaceae bacterium]
MKTSTSSLVLAASLLTRCALGLPALAIAVTLVTSTTLVACDDENDPKTWVKRLDDPAQRAGAIKRLTQFFEDDMTKANKNRDDPAVKTLLDDIVDPMTKQYVASTLDEKTRKDLMKFLADTKDPRTGPALAKAFNEYEPGKNEEDVKYAAKAVQGLAEAKKLTDQTVKDALWNCFDKFQVSKTKMFELVKALHDAVIAVSDPSYGPKAVGKLNAAVDPKNVDSVRDQLQFWQLTAVQIVGNLKFVPAVKPLVAVLLAPTKKDLSATAKNSLLKMAKDAEPVLISALNGSDKDFATAEAIDTNKEYVAVIGDTLSNISRPAGRDAVLAALASADNDTNRTVLAAFLTKFPSDPRLVPAFLATYKKVGANTSIDALQGANAHGYLTQAAQNFYDPTLTDWLVKEIITAKGDEADAMQLLALDSAIKLMQPAQKAAVQNAVNKEGTDREKDKFQRAAAVMDKCGTDANCYANATEQMIPSTPPTATMTAAKGAWMAAIYGNAATKTALAAKVDKVKNSSARFDIVMAIDHLAPNGDTTVASQLETVVNGDTSSGNKELLMADDVVAKVAARLRARAQ